MPINAKSSAGASPPKLGKDGKDTDGISMLGKENGSPPPSFFAGFGASALSGLTNFFIGEAAFLAFASSIALCSGETTPKDRFWAYAAA